jgi:thiamine-monophosphate kinase
VLTVVPPEGTTSSEFTRAARLREALKGAPSPSIVLGNGDDAAVLRPGGDVVVTTDVLVEGVDFAAWAPWDAVGHKAVAVNLSDLAAMGAEPLAYLMSLCLPRGFPEPHVEALSAGMASCGALHGLPCVGGDLSRTSGPVVVGVTALGTVPPGLALTRSGARPGDGIWVSGVLGAASTGLGLLSQQAGLSRNILETLEKFASGAHREAVRAQLAPTPRLALGRALRGVASGCVDVSDGLAQDLCHLLVASGVGARVEVARLPAHPSADPAHVLSGGEDFELLFTASDAAAVERASRACGVPVTRVGQVTAGPGLDLVGLVSLPGEDVGRLDMGEMPRVSGAQGLRGYVHFPAAP